MVGFRQDNDGNYLNDSGDALSKDYAGNLWSGGAMVGRATFGGPERVSVFDDHPSTTEFWKPSPPKSSFAPAWNSPAPTAYGPAPVGGASNQVSIEGGSTALVGWLVWPWMLALAIAAGMFVSAPSFVQGMHLHPILGVGTFMLALWTCHLLMALTPTALFISIAMSLCWGVIVFALANPGTFPRGLTFGNFSAWLTHTEPTAIWRIVSQRFSNGANGWAVVMFAISLAMHWGYWRNARRSVARTIRQPELLGKNILSIVLISAVVGGLMSLKW